MAMTVRITETAANTSTGNQDITVGGYTGTPDGCILVMTDGITNGTAAADMRISIGAASATTERWANHLNSEDAQGTSDESTGPSQTDNVIIMSNVGTATVSALADIVAFITGGIRINWSNAPAGAFQILAIFFEGDNVYAGNATMNATQNNSTDVTAPGFEPDFVFGLIMHRITGDADSIAHNRWGMGLAHWDGVAVTQRAAILDSRNNQTTYNVDGQIVNNRIAGVCDNTGVLQYSVEIGSFDASGFSITTRDGNTVSSTDFYYICGNGAVDYSLDDSLTPASTGVNSYEGPAFTPQAAIGIMTQFTAINTARNNSAEAGSFGICAFDGTEEYSLSGSKEDNVGTTNTQSLADNTAINLPLDDGTAGYEAAFDSFDSLGYNLNFSQVLAASAQAYMFVLTFEEEAGEPAISISDTITISETVSPLLTHFANVSNTITLSETITPALIYQISASESITISETITLVLIHLINVSDIVTMSEVISLLQTHFVSVSDTVTMTESIISLLVHLINVSNSITLSEDIVALLIHLVDVSDTITMTEIITMLLTGFIDVSDTITVSESINIVIQIAGVLLIGVEDTVAITETIEQLLISFIGVSDTVTITEIIQPLIELLINVGDTVTLTETIGRLLINLVNVSDIVTITENTNLLLTHLINVSDTVIITEILNLVIQAANVLLVNVEDTVTVTENINRLLTNFISISDAITIIEILNFSLINLVGVSDTITITQSLNVLLTHLISVSDNVIMTESINTLLTGFINVSDPITITETITALLAGDLSINVSDTITINESILISTLAVLLKAKFKGMRRGMWRGMQE